MSIQLIATTTFGLEAVVKRGGQGQPGEAGQAGGRSGGPPGLPDDGRL